MFVCRDGQGIQQMVENGVEPQVVSGLGLVEGIADGGGAAGQQIVRSAGDDADVIR